MIRRQCTLWAALLLSGCLTIPSPQHRLTAAEQVAAQAGFTLYRTSSPLPVLAAARLLPAHGPIWVFIEGDGYAWQTPRRPSGDPTPRQPIALHLAAATPDRSVIYLGRPCQYGLAASCEVQHWTNARFAPPIIESLNAALTAILAQDPGRPLLLIGFSGGATIARALLARRHDIVGLVSVAGVLDADLWTAYHKVTPLSPIAPLAGLHHLAQLHFAGADDPIVPPALLAKTALPGTLFSLPDTGHLEGWTFHWPQMQQQIANLWSQ